MLVGRLDAVRILVKATVGSGWVADVMVMIAPLAMMTGVSMSMSLSSDDDRGVTVVIMLAGCGMEKPKHGFVIGPVDFRMVVIPLD